MSIFNKPTDKRLIDTKDHNMCKGYNLVVDIASAKKTNLSVFVMV
jgi:hypothetical protein